MLRVVDALAVLEHRKGSGLVPIGCALSKAAMSIFYRIHFDRHTILQLSDPPFVPVSGQTDGLTARCPHGLHYNTLSWILRACVESSAALQSCAALASLAVSHLLQQPALRIYVMLQRGAHSGASGRTEPQRGAADCTGCSRGRSLRRDGTERSTRRRCADGAGPKSGFSPQQQGAMRMLLETRINEMCQAHVKSQLCPAALKITSKEQPSLTFKAHKKMLYWISDKISWLNE